MNPLSLFPLLTDPYNAVGSMVGFLLIVFGLLAIATSERVSPVTKAVGSAVGAKFV